MSKQFLYLIYSYFCSLNKFSSSRFFALSLMNYFTVTRCLLKLDICLSNPQIPNKIGRRLSEHLRILFACSSPGNQMSLLLLSDEGCARGMWSQTWYKEGRTGVFSWCVISWFNFPWNLNSIIFSTWSVIQRFFVTREELQLITDIRDLTTLFHVILSRETSGDLWRLKTPNVISIQLSQTLVRQQQLARMINERSI